MIKVNKQEIENLSINVIKSKLLLSNNEKQNKKLNKQI